mmetsp:Transcript_15502/g.41567  ORF Transcript_15502/g.41567 Transcript_15502/m.41567 type:complete len:525 (+) Transcript_15502:54-1628(+)
MEEGDAISALGAWHTTVLAANTFVIVAVWAALRSRWRAPSSLGVGKGTPTATILSCAAHAAAVALRLRTNQVQCSTPSARRVHLAPAGVPSSSASEESDEVDLCSEPESAVEAPTPLAVPCPGTLQGPTVFTDAQVEDAWSLLASFYSDREGFESIICQPDLRFSRRAVSAHCSEYLTEGRVNCSVATFLSLWVDAPFRSTWDAGLAGLEELPDGAIYHAVKYPYPLKPRYYVYDRDVRSGPGGACLILAQSAATRLDAAFSTSRPGVFCPAFLSYTAVRPCPTPEVAAGEGDAAADAACPGQCEFVMLTRDEQAVALPSWALGGLLRTTYPAYMDKVRAAATARQAAVDSGDAEHSAFIRELLAPEGPSCAGGRSDAEGRPAEARSAPPEQVAAAEPTLGNTPPSSSAGVGPAVGSPPAPPRRARPPEPARSAPVCTSESAPVPVSRSARHTPSDVINHEDEVEPAAAGPTPPRRRTTGPRAPAFDGSGAGSHFVSSPVGRAVRIPSGPAALRGTPVTLAFVA